MSMSDVFVIMIELFAAIIGVIFVFYVFTTISHDTTAIQTFSNSGGDLTIAQKGPESITILDMGVAIILFMSGIVSIALAAFARSHPLFFVLSLILQMFFVMISAMLSNIFFAFTQNPVIASVMTSFPVSTLIFGTFFPLFILVISVIIAIVQYSTPTQGGMSI